jgi:transposase-like protein/DDE family transposase
MIKDTIRAWSARGEFAYADLGDTRRGERLLRVAGLLEREPGSSFPRAMGSDAALEGLYRFLNNKGFGAEAIVAPHIAATVERARAAQTVIAIHDTTHVEFAAKREDLGPTTGKNRFGFAAHMVLLVDEKDGLPLGCGHFETLKRTGKKRRQRERLGQKRATPGDKTRESLRWIHGFDAIEDARNEEFEVIHVADAEADFFELLAHITQRNGRFVIRAGQLERTVLDDGEPESLREIANRISPTAWREVELGERKHRPRTFNPGRLRRHPERASRSAKLAIGATRIAIKKSSYSGVQSAPFEVNVVRIWEPAPPRGESPIEWILLTTENSCSASALHRITDIYRKRWIIEEYFKALKTGCSLEKRQVESYAALCKVLALFIPIACRLLLLRGLERIDAQIPAARVFSQIDLKLMASAPSNRTLPSPKTIADAMNHLARLGGHIRNNGRPGWQTLAWGYEKLLMIRLGWELATAQKCDQS